MKTILVTILTRSGTLNPPNSVICSVLHRLGYGDAQTVRLGKCIEFEVDDNVDVSAFGARIKEDLKKSHYAYLFNPITDECRVEQK